MRISHTSEIEAGQVLFPIGRIEAVSCWHASDARPTGRDWKDVALDRLIATAKDYDADAIVNVDYHVDGVQAFDLAAVPLQRVSVTGLAVRIARG